MEYEIRLADQLDAHWATTFEGMQLRRDPSDRGTTLRGQVVDQTALHGLLARIRDLGLTLLSVRAVDGNTPPD